MKAYLSITGIIFGLFALWHAFELLSNWRTLASDRWFTIGVLLIFVVSGALSIWAWILLKLHRRAVAKSSGNGATLH